MYGDIEKESVWSTTSPFGAESPSAMNLDANGVSYWSTRLVYTVNKLVSVNANVIKNRQCDCERDSGRERAVNVDLGVNKPRM
jgi:hypothetical protein